MLSTPFMVYFVAAMYMSRAPMANTASCIYGAKTMLGFPMLNAQIAICNIPQMNVISREPLHLAISKPIGVKPRRTAL